MVGAGGCDWWLGLGVVTGGCDWWLGVGAGGCDWWLWLGVVTGGWAGGWAGAWELGVVAGDGQPGWVGVRVRAGRHGGRTPPLSLCLELRTALPLPRVDT